MILLSDVLTTVSMCILYIIFVTQRGKTALTFASYKNHMETVKVMLAAGADINRQDNVSVG